MPAKFGRAGSAAARKTIRTAFEHLNGTITPEDSRDFNDTTLQHVRDAAVQIEGQLAARQSLRNMRRLMPLFQGLEHYAKVVDVLCNGTPYLAWIWAPITVILRLASEYVEAFEAIMKGYSKIAESLVRFEILQNAFSDTSEFQQTLAVFYSDILQFHQSAYTFLRRSSWKLMFLTSWGRFERRFDGILEDLDRHGSLIDQEANARHISESRQQWQAAQSWREENEERLAKQEVEQSIKQFEHIKSWLKADDSEQLSIQDIASLEGTKYPGTCSWALENQKLRAWLRKDPDSCICWLQGIPGAGKTVLLTQIQAFMRSDSRIVISHFMSSSLSSSTSYDQFLRSLLLQLLRQDGDLTAHVYNKYVLEKRTTSTTTLEQLVKMLFTSASKEPRSTQFLWILIDTFEACESNKQASLISLINQLVSKNPQSGGTVCKFLIASRTSPILSKRLSKNQVLSMTKEKVALDVAIRNYASHRMDSLRDRFDQLHLDHTDLEIIKTAIANKSDGMFLYARLILDYIGRKIFYSAAEVRKSIDDLPQELSDYYREIIARIIAPLDKESIERVRSLFGWLAFSRRPLKRLELLSAVTFSSSNHLVSKIVPDFILTVCGTLIEERPNATLAFIHSTVKEFLQSTTSNLPLYDTSSSFEHGIAAVTCLRAGLHVFCPNTARHAQNLSVVQGLHGFHLYASEHWVDYLLAVAAISPKPINEVPLYQAAVALAAQSNEIEAQHAIDHDQVGINGDERLSLIPDLQLRKLVGLCLQSRSPEIVDRQLFQANDTNDTLERKDETVPITALQATTAVYQDIVRFLLDQNDYPETSSEELQRFKNQFRDAAFTCRFGTCPFATTGFNSGTARDKHELAHSKPFTCPIPDCQYPAFISKAAVQRHVMKFHPVRIDQKPIRRPDTSKMSARRMPEMPAISTELRSATAEHARFAASEEQIIIHIDPRTRTLPNPLQPHEVAQMPPFADLEAFLQQLKSFAEASNNPVNLTPTVRGMDISLPHLFDVARRFGFYWNITQKNLWTEVAAYLGFHIAMFPAIGTDIQGLYRDSLLGFENAWTEKMQESEGQPHVDAIANRPEIVPQSGGTTTQDMSLQGQQYPTQSANIKPEPHEPLGQMRRGTLTAKDFSPAQRQWLQQEAINRFNSLNEQQRSYYRQLAMEKLNPQQIHFLNSKGQDAALYYIQQTLLSSVLSKMYMPQNGGMDTMQIPAQQQAQLQQAQQRSTNPEGQQARQATGDMDLSRSSQVELLNIQKAAMMAQEAGQLKGPRHSAGSWNEPFIYIPPNEEIPFSR